MQGFIGAIPNVLFGSSVCCNFALQIAKRPHWAALDSISLIFDCMPSNLCDNKHFWDGQIMPLDVTFAMTPSITTLTSNNRHFGELRPYNLWDHLFHPRVQCGRLHSRTGRQWGILVFLYIEGRLIWHNSRMPSRNRRISAVMKSVIIGLNLICFKVISQNKFSM